MTARLFALLTWTAVAASAVFWGLRLGARPLPVPPQAGIADAGAPVAGADLTRLFGAPAAPAAPVEAEAAPADARFRLVGVVAPVAGQRAGLALIAVDGKAARAVGVGGVVDGELAVTAVSHRRVELAPRSGGPVMVLELPTLPEAARGSLAGLAPGAVPGTVPGAAPQTPAAPFGTVPPGGFPIRPPTVIPGRPGLPSAPGSPNVMPGAPQMQNLLPPQPAPFGVTPQPQPASPGNPPPTS